MPVQDAREKHWVEQIKKKSFRSALLICGHAHALSVSFKLQAAGFEVEKALVQIPYEKLCTLKHC